MPALFLHPRRPSDLQFPLPSPDEPLSLFLNVGNVSVKPCDRGLDRIRNHLGKRKKQIRKATTRARVKIRWEIIRRRICVSLLAGFPFKQDKPHNYSKDERRMTKEFVSYFFHLFCNLFFLLLVSFAKLAPKSIGTYFPPLHQRLCRIPASPLLARSTAVARQLVHWWGNQETYNRRASRERCAPF